MTYYMIKEPIAPGTLNIPERDILELVNFGKKIYCKPVCKDAWGYLELAKPLQKDQQAALGLVQDYGSDLEDLFDDPADGNPKESCLKDSTIESLWEEFADVPMNPYTECMEEDFMFFKAGTYREDIWKWFDKHHSKGVYWLLYCMEGEKRKNE